MKVDYNVAATAYAKNRRLNARTLDRLIQIGKLTRQTRALEVGCGSGNYSSALADIVGCHCHGLEPSEGMLAQAKGQSSAVVWMQGHAEAIPYPDESFDCLFCVDVIHHLPSPERFLREAFRVLNFGGRLCIATDSEWTIRQRNPLSVYFPATIEKELERYPSLARLKTSITAAGFSDLTDEIVEMPYQLEQSAAYRAKAFSCLQLIDDQAFVAGLERMERDLACGPLSCVDRHALLSAIKS